VPAKKAESAHRTPRGTSAGARRVTAPAPPPQRGPLLPFAAGLACGVALAFFLGVGGEETPAAVAPPASDASAGNTGIRFEFPDILREAEVLVPYVEEYLQPEIAEPENVDYMLQAGAFRSADDADRRRASVLLLDLEARTLKITRDGNTWHRVLVGPFSDRSSVRNAQVKLLEEDIDSIVLKTEKDA
jgi:hypothetical protein